MPSPAQIATSLFAGVWVDGDGPIDSLILLVGQAPGKMENIAGIPFVGPAGKMLQGCVAEAALDWSTMRRTNVIRCMLPPGRPVPAGAPTDDEIKEYLPWLLEEIASMPNLKVIVALGNDALKALSKKSGITDKRGEEFEWTHPNTQKTYTLLPTFHPSYVLRRPTQRQILVHDLVRANKLAHGVPLAEPAQSITHLTAFGGEPSFNAGKLAIDVETDEHDKMCLVGIGWKPEQIYIVPRGLAQTVIETQGSSSVKFGSRFPTWIGHNLRADQKWLREAGINLTPIREDTMLKAHLLNENRSMALKKLALELLDPALYWKFVEPRLKKPETRGLIPYDELAAYCANDVAATLLINDVLDKQMEAEPSLERIYHHISLPLSDVLLGVETHGVLWDVDAAEKLAERYKAQVAAAEVHLNGIVGGGVVSNWNSDVQVARLLFAVLGLPIQKKTPKGTRGSVDEQSLMHLRDAHPVVPILIERNTIQKRMEIVDGWTRRAVNGYVYPHYNQASVTTGRLSGSDPNPQNLPTATEIRSLVIAPKGYSLVAADYKTLEIGVAAWIFGEATILENYMAGADLHYITAMALLGRPPLDKAERKKFGKTPNFGLLYQQDDYGFREYAFKKGVEMTMDEAKNMRARWHNLYPGVRAGWKKIGWEMKNNNGVSMAPDGRMRRLPEFLSGNSSLVNHAWRQGCNFPVQWMATAFTHVAAILAGPELARLYNAQLILHVHDQLVFEVPEECATGAAVMLRSIMEKNVPAYYESLLNTPIPIPLFAEVEIGQNWGFVDVQGSDIIAAYDAEIDKRAGM